MDITLTAAERDEILAVFQTWEDNPSVDERALMVEAVEIILAARLTGQREQDEELARGYAKIALDTQRKLIAAELEAKGRDCQNEKYWYEFAHAARIVREWGAR